MRFEKGEKYSQKVYTTQTDAELAPFLVLTNPITH